MTRGAGSFRRGVLPLLLLQVFLAGLYADALPVFEGPDAEGHLAYVAELQAAPFGKPRLDAATAARSHELVQQPPLYYLAVAAQLEPGQAAALSEAFERNPGYPGLSHWVSRPALVDRAAQAPAGPIAVWISLLGALLCTAATYALVRQLPGGRRGLALLAAAIVALNPQFLHSAASLTNDAWAAGLAALAMAAALRTRQATVRKGTRGRRGWLVATAWGLLTGAVLGLAMLTKYSALLLVVPASLLLLSGAHRSRRLRGRQALAGAATALAIALVAGPWLAANWRETGEWLPLAAMRRLLPQLFRAQPMNWTDALYEALWAGRSYWGVFGHGVVAPPGYFALVHGFILLALLGAARAVLGPAGPRSRGLGQRLRRFGPLLALGLAVWILLTSTAFVRWVRMVHFANQGRLLFGMAPVVAYFLAWGWLGLARTRRRPALRSGIVLWVGLGLSQVTTLWQAYRPPPALAAARPQTVLEAEFGEGLQLLGLELADPEVEEGEAIRLRLYWRAEHPIDEDAMLFVHAVDAAGVKRAAEDRIPLAGRHPTTAWRPGEVFAEDWEPVVAGLGGPERVDLVLGAYRGEDPAARLGVRDGAGRPLGTELRLAQLYLRPRGAEDPPCPLFPGPSPAPAAWTAGMRLDAWGLRLGPGGWPRDLRLCWSAAEAPRRERRLFVHVLDGRGAILGQWDGQPRQGARPLATWSRQTRVYDSIRIARPAGAAAGAAASLTIGWYDPVSGQRELLTTGLDQLDLWRTGTLTQLPSPSSSR